MSRFERRSRAEEKGLPIDAPQPQHWHGVFVPAVMSVGVLFSIATLLRDAFRWMGGNALERRIALNSGESVSWVLGERKPRPEDLGMLPRSAYLVSASLFTAGALYVAIGSIANFLRDGGYVADIGWLLAVSLGLSVVLVLLGAVALAAFRSWPLPPEHALAGFRFGPFTSAYDGTDSRGPSWAVTTALLATGVVTMLLVLMVGTGRSIALAIDRPIAAWLVELVSLDRLATIDVFGATWLAVLLAAGVGVAAVRCRVLAWVYPAAVAGGLFATFVLRELIERPRPIGVGIGESFPSGHMVQAVLIAGLLPLAVWIISGDRRSVAVGRLLLWVAVVVTALNRIHTQAHWPLDVAAGLALGLTIVSSAHWAIAHGTWHVRCPSCPWSASPAPPVWSRLLIHLSDRAATTVGRLGSLAAVLGAAALLVATVIIGVPEDPEGYGLASDLGTPLQVGLAVVLLGSGFLALRWKAVAAVMMAVAGAALGVYSAVQYEPLVAVALSAVIFVPAVLTWVAWQKDETVGRIAVLAATTLVLIGTTWIGAQTVHAAFFGPSHPESTVATSPPTEAAWMWVGGVTGTEATVVAGGLDDEEAFVLWLVSEDGRPHAVTVVTGSNGLVRHTWTDLEPAKLYRYGITEPGAARTTDGWFSTFSEGPQDLTIVAGACARTGSNGAVFDAMRDLDPDLYINVGDLHYSNLDSESPSDHITAYHRALIQPAQSALYRSTAMAYVWDDHDFGPNDADSTASSRDAVSLAYRRAVPHYGVDPDPSQSIAQAFTVGRVRVVLTDTRSMRTAETMLGETQLGWLLDELASASETHALVVWVSPTPWVSQTGGSADDWSAYPAERRLIADAIAATGIDNLVMLSGDAHMVAIDDGSNTDYSITGGGGFPLLHAAALDRPGSVKGGPYSEGAFPGSGQFGVIEVEDDGGSTVSITLSGRTWAGDTLVSYAFDVGVPGTLGSGG